MFSCHHLDLCGTGSHRAILYINIYSFMLYMPLCSTPQGNLNCANNPTIISLFSGTPTLLQPTKMYSLLCVIQSAGCSSQNHENEQMWNLVVLAFMCGTGPGRLKGEYRGISLLGQRYFCYSLTSPLQLSSLIQASTLLLYKLYSIGRDTRARGRTHAGKHKNKQRSTCVRRRGGRG